MIFVLVLESLCSSKIVYFQHWYIRGNWFLSLSISIARKAVSQHQVETIGLEQPLRVENPQCRFRIYGERKLHEQFQENNLVEESQLELPDLIPIA